MKLLLALILALAPLATISGGERFACNLKALSSSERARHEKLTRTLLSTVQGHSELANGYAFRFPAGTLMTVAEWVALEHRCCPFFTFAIEQAADEGPLELRVTGSKGVKAFIKDEFGL